ncbi:MAG: hypothetical protein RBT39_18515, partial [Azoarcus sp.]|nr:hypothetical protein [Azoarcus sp.]
MFGFFKKSGKSEKPAVKPSADAPSAPPGIESVPSAPAPLADEERVVPAIPEPEAAEPAPPKAAEAVPPVPAAVAP